MIRKRRVGKQEHMIVGVALLLGIVTSLYKLHQQLESIGWSDLIPSFITLVVYVVIWILITRRLNRRPEIRKGFIRQREATVRKSNKKILLRLSIILLVGIVIQIWSYYDSMLIRDHTYINKDIGVTFEFPEGWHPNFENSIQERKDSNILVGVYKHLPTEFSSETEWVQSGFFPHFLLTGYAIDENHLPWSEQVDWIMKKQFREHQVDYHILTAHNVENTPHDAYEVVLEHLDVLSGESIKASIFFTRKSSSLFCLWFADQMPFFEKHRHVYTDAKKSFKILI